MVKTRVIGVKQLIGSGYKWVVQTESTMYPNVASFVPYGSRKVARQVAKEIRNANR